MNLFQRSGTGTQQTAAFPVPSNWDLAWAFDCAGPDTGTGSFNVAVGSQGGATAGDVPVNQSGAHGAGVEPYHAGGSIHLTINTACQWRVAAVPGGTTVATFDTWTGVKPSEVQFSGDAGDIVTNLTWTSWTPASAVGEGSWQYDDCNPDCARGKVTPVPAILTLSQSADGQFTHIVEVTTGPHGQTQSFALPGWFFRASS